MNSKRRSVDDPDDVDAAEGTALRILAGASQAASALEHRLRLRGFSAVATREAVERCRRLGYIDDGALAAALVGRAQRAGHGRGRVVADLRRRGVTREAAAEALGAIDDEDQERTATELAQRLYDREALHGDADDRARQRIAAALQRRGFTTAVILKALRAVRP